MPHLVYIHLVDSVPRFGRFKLYKLCNHLSLTGILSMLIAAGCATNTATLPQLPGNGQGGSGNLQFANPVNQPLLAAVVGRTSTYLLVTVGATGSNSVRCSSTTSSVTIGNNAANCTLSLAPSAVPSSGSLSVDVTALDANSHSSATQTFAIPVSQALTLTPPSPDPAANNAVIGRSYGNGQQKLTWTANGGIGTYQFSPATPAGMNCQTSGNLYTCSSPSISGTPGTVSFTVTVQDSGNGPTPPAPAPVPSTSPTSITLVPEIQAAWNQAPDTVAAVTGRSYGEVGTGQTSAAAPTYAVTNNGGL